MFSLICVWINGWVNNRGAGDLRRYRAHYHVTVMFMPYDVLQSVFYNVSVYSRVCHRSCFDLFCCVLRDSFALFTHVLQGCFVSTGTMEYAARQPLLGPHTILISCHVVTQIRVSCGRIYWINGRAEVPVERLKYTVASILRCRGLSTRTFHLRVPDLKMSCNECA